MEATSRRRDLFVSQFEGLSIITVRRFKGRPFHPRQEGYEALGIHMTLDQERDRVARDQECITPTGPS